MFAGLQPGQLVVRVQLGHRNPLGVPLGEREGTGSEDRVEVADLARPRDQVVRTQELVGAFVVPSRRRPAHVRRVENSEGGQTDHVRFRNVGCRKVGLAPVAFQEVRLVVALRTVGIRGGVVQLTGTNAIETHVIAGVFITVVDPVSVGVISVHPVLVLVGVPVLVQILLFQPVELQEGPQVCDAVVRPDFLFREVVALLIDQTVFVVVHPVGGVARTFQEGKTHDSRPDAADPDTVHVPEVGHVEKLVEVAEVVLVKLVALVADSGVRQVAEGYSRQGVVRNVGDVVLPEDGIAGLDVVPLVHANLHADADPAPRTPFLNGHIRSLVPNANPGPRVVLHRRVVLQVFLVLSVVGDEVGFQIGVLHAPSETAIPLAWPFLLVAAGRPAFRRPRLRTVAHGHVLVVLVEVAEDRVQAPAHGAGWVRVHSLPEIRFHEVERVQQA